MHSLIKNPLTSENGNPVHKYGIYSWTLNKMTVFTNVKNIQDNVSGIAHRVDGIRLEDNNVTHIPKTPVKLTGVLTQGDKLNQIKARRTLSPNVNCGTDSTASVSVVQ